MIERAEHIREQSIAAKMSIDLSAVVDASERLTEALKRGNKLLVCGNGGSAGDAQHIAGEFINRFLLERKPLPCIALSTDSSVLTAIANDYSFEEVFSKQIEALGMTGDFLMAISTSGESKNVIRAVKAAREKGMISIGLLGRNGGSLAALVDIPLIVPVIETPRIQEGHLLIFHIMCELVEANLFGKK
ncbi:MAG TPA: D-sedoheptulose 7-phosphate isomerase [Candidatus Nanoarchaeia archaeon]|nr:D-sedoheptulose 7-phosphate isomerase [Candidatus Nanoarchaeia archaeon]